MADHLDRNGDMLLIQTCALLALLSVIWTSSVLRTVLVCALAVPFLASAGLALIQTLSGMDRSRSSARSRTRQPRPSPIDWQMLVERRRQEQRDVGMALHDSAVLPRSLDCRLLERALDDLVRGVIVRNYVWSWWKSVGSVHVASSCISSTGQASTSSGPRSTSPDICTTILNYCLTSYLASLPPAMPSPSYVTSSASPLLPETIECTLRYTIHALATRLSNVDPEYLVVERIVPLIIRHVREYKRALAVVNQSGRRHLSRTAEDGERMVVEAFRARATASATAKISTTGGIASSLDTTASELAHLRTIATTRILPALLPPTLLNSPTIRMLLREILVACILHPILTMLRDPDYWNQTMDMYATRAVSELRMVRKVREALERPFHEQAGAHGDAHGGGLPFMNVDEDSSQIFGNSAKTSLPTFDEYLGHIRDCQNLVDAKQIRNALVVEIRKKRLEIMDKRDKDMVKGQRVDDVKKYISRLSTAKRRAEKRILQLGGKLYNQREEKSSIDVNGSSAANEVANGTRRIRVASPTDSMLGEGVGVSALLCEPGLTYFREFMEGEKLVMVLEFWLTIDTISRQYLDPLTLETHTGDVPAEAVASLFDTTDRTRLRRLETTLREDIAMVHRKYFSVGEENEWRARVFGDGGEAVRVHYEMLLSVPASQEVATYRTLLATLLGLIIRAQHDAYGFMETSLLPMFMTSESYVRLLADPVFLSVDRPDSAASKAKSFGKTMAFLENMLKKRLRADVHLSTANSTPLSESPTSKAGTFLRSIASGSGSSGGKIGSLFHKDTSLQTLLDGDSKEKDAILQRSPPSAPPLSAPEEAQVASSPNADDVPFVATEEIDLLTSDTVEAFEQAFQQIVLESSAAVDSDDNHHVIDTDDAEHSDNGVVAGDLSEATDLESEMSDDGDMSNGGEETSARIEERSITSGGTPSTTRADDTPPETPRLQLEQQLKSIKQQMDIIRQQDALLTLMIDKAKRGGDNAQSSAAKTSLLKQIALLTKTKWQYEQELKTFDFQKTQLELQLDDGMIRPGRIAISIPSWAAGESSAMNATGIARPFVVFIIEATQIDDEEERKGAPSGSGWIVARRYSEFHTLHRRLKAAFPSIMGRYELPGKRFLANVFDTAREQRFMEERRAALEQYLRALCNDAVIASSWEFRQFLCLSDFSKATKSRDLRQNGIENKLLSGLRSAFDPSGNLSRRLLGRSKKKHERRNSLPPMSLVDILTQKLGHALHRDGSGHEGDDMDSEDLMSPVGEDASLRPLPPTIHVERDSKSGSPTEQGMHDRIRAQIEESLDTPIHTQNWRPRSPINRQETSPNPELATPEATTSDDPLIDLFIEIFELREKSNWLRRQAVQLVLQQILGGAIERRVADTVRWAVASEEMWCWYVGRVRETLEFYAGEEKVRAWRPRTEEERHATKVDAFKKLMVLVPDVLGSMVGRGNAKRGTARVFGALQNERLNAELLYKIFDELVDAVVNPSVVNT